MWTQKDTYSPVCEENTLHLQFLLSGLSQQQLQIKSKVLKA